MRRGLFNVLTAVLLLLCIATVVIWISSYWLFFTVMTPITNSHGSMTMAQRGRTAFCILGDGPWPLAFNYEAASSPLRDSFDLKCFGFGLDWKHSESRALIVPLWFVEIVLLGCSAWLVRYSRRNKSPGACPECGYDLRATPDRCPECGAIPAKSD
jgi:hypothetical protein